MDLEDSVVAMVRELLQERPYHQALGVLLNTPEAVYMGPNMRSFGHHGLGGSIGFGSGSCISDSQVWSIGSTGWPSRAMLPIDTVARSGRSSGWRNGFCKVK